MNQNEKIQNVLTAMLASRAGLVGAQRVVNNAEAAVIRCQAEALRVLLASDRKPVLFRNVMYSVQATPEDYPDLIHEKQMDFIDLTQKE